jgi:hypothetical protein
MSVRILIIALITRLCLVMAVDRWGAYKTQQFNVNNFDKASGFGTLNSFATTIQTSTGDKALLLINGDYFRKGTGSSGFDMDLLFDVNTIFGPTPTTTDLAGAQYFTDLQNNDARESQPINFMYLDTAPATSVQYMANVKGAGKLSNSGQVRCFDVAVFPSTTIIVSNAQSAAISVTGSGNAYTAWSADVTVTVASPTDKVLLLMSVPFYSSTTGNSHAAFTIYRGGSAGTIAAPNLVVQTIGGTDPNAGRQVTGAFVDSPGISGPVKYAGMVRKLNTYAGAPTDFTLSRGGNPFRSLIAIVLPEESVAHAQISTEYLVISPTWVTVPGLSVQSTSSDASDYVMIVVNINYFCTSGSAATGYFTVFQDESPLPGHDGSTGMHVVKIIRRNETIAATMTAIVSPGTTSAVTFSVKVWVDGGAFTVGGYGQTSSITVVKQPAFVGPTPTAVPTSGPPTVKPTVAPSAKPTIAPTMPTAKPTTAPTSLTAAPTAAPSISPTVSSSVEPTCKPTAVPTTEAPSRTPTVGPSKSPTAAPSLAPSASPTVAPSCSPTASPSAVPTCAPTTAPTTAVPSATPTVQPSRSPTAEPSAVPTAPTATPTAKPTAEPAVCTTSCTFGGEYYYASPRTLIQNVAQLPPSFVVEFDAKYTKLLTSTQAAAGPVAVLEFRNQATQSQLLAIRMTINRNIALVYNDVVLDDASVTFKNNFALTHFKVTVTSTSVAVVSSADTTWISTYPISALVDTSDQIYSLYVNSPSSTNDVQVNDLTITGKRHTE